MNRRLIEVRERILRMLMRNLYPVRDDPMGRPKPVRSARPLTMLTIAWPDRQPWEQTFIAMNMNLDHTADTFERQKHPSGNRSQRTYTN
jgi:hypothetical protein